ncbi:MAG: alpha/beta hydrolase [Flavobacteriaceae bacterium]|nr:alpha/beta hydrolase [Flavobacteriaceae bacterium]
MPGLAANSKIFQQINLPKDRFELHYLEWIMPISVTETLEDYALRMSEFIKEKNTILIGVSFGGILVQEIGKIINPKKIVIISSIKSNKEFSKQLQLIKRTKSYLFFPSSSITTLENIIYRFSKKKTQKRIEGYKMYLSVRNPLYLKWAIHATLHWSQKNPPPNILHIHGTADHIFPIKNITNYIPIQNGPHVMIITKAKEINALLIKYL